MRVWTRIPRTGWLVLSLVLACGTPPEPESAPVESESPESEPPESEPPESEPPEPEPPAGPSAFTSISFDLRSLPHRGPYDVDPHFIESRRGVLMVEARTAAGEPAPRFLVQPGSTVFRAEFYGSLTEALAQCRRVVAAVAPLPDPSEPERPRMAVSRPSATPCTAM
ncbi:MAG: hypothetical protein AB8I08_27575 [Sandaracinaceae bacterium]